MKIIFSECTPDYSSYTFPYGIYCIQEEADPVSEIYNRGFLPYSADPNLRHQIFYLSRSLRIDLDRFTDSSENRRVDRKISPLDIEMNHHQKHFVLSSDRNFSGFASDYAKQRIGSEYLDEDRLRYILNLDIGNTVFAFTADGRPVGYVLGCQSEHVLHYWFAFFDTALMRSHSLGKWMMWKVATWAKSQDFHYLYLGTCYGEKSLYKVRDHKGLEFFDGSGWNDDINLLKHWCKSDISTESQDRLKQSKNRNDYLSTILNRNMMRS